jgi:uncharacterized protein
MSCALLDINVLIALLDLDHSHHQIAREWLEKEIDHGWASSAITQNGCIRIMSQKAYPNSFPLQAILDKLRTATSTSHHHFWNSNLSILNQSIFQSEHIHGPKQLTDIYLLGLAVHNRGRFVTFDEAIPITSVKGARSHHLVKI